MQTSVAQKMKNDPYIAKALAEKRRKTHKTLLLVLAVVWTFCVLLCLLAHFDGVAWAATLACALLLSVLLYFLFLPVSLSYNRHIVLYKFKVHRLTI